VDKALETKQQEEEIFNYQKMLDKREANKKAQEQLKKEETTKYMLFYVLIAFNNNFLQVIYTKLLHCCEI
jgi:C4-dicarboxylate transporter